MPTSPTPADHPADQLRAAAEKLRTARFSGAITATPTVAALIGARLPLAGWLERAADASDHHGGKEAGAVATLVHPALAVARQLLGTTSEDTAAALEPQDHPGADLFAALQHAGLDVDEANARMTAYAAMVLRQEKATAAPPADRRARYAAAIRETDGWVLDDGQHMIDAVMAVADAEQASLRAEAEGLDEALRGAISASEKDGARLRAEMERRTLMLQASRDRVARLTAEPAALPALAEVWTVWREDEPIHAHYATVDDARQGTIDCWQDDEPVCPDYSWRQDGPRLELVVGGEGSGVYASRHRVYGAPPAPADRASVIDEAATALEKRHAELINYAAEHASDALEDRAQEWAWAAATVRALAADAAAGVQPPTSEAHPAEHTWAAELHDPLANEWVPGTRYAVRDRAVNALEHGRKVAATWKDGAPTARRLVRATTTYTVEPEPAAPAAPEEQAR